MAYAVTRKLKSVTGGQRGSVGPRTLASNQFMSWDALAYDTTTNLPAEYVTEPDIITDLNFPLVNQTLFTWDSARFATAPAPATRQVIPWLICSNKRAERDLDQRNLFRVHAEFSTPQAMHGISETDLLPIDIPAAADSFPHITEINWGEDQRVIWGEPTTGDPTDMRLPTGNLYAEPFRRRFPKRTVRVHQFEDLTVSEITTKIEERLFSIQRGVEFQGDPTPNTDRQEEPWPRWMVTAVDYQILSTQNLTGYGDSNLVLMSYTLERNERDGGWLERRALIDNYHLTTANDLDTKTPYYDPIDQNTIVDALLDEDGVLKDPQTGDPDFINYLTQPGELSWTWLKGATP